MSDEDRPMDTMRFMGQWLTFGDDAADPYIRFMAYWVAFNMAYSSYKHWGEKAAEWKAIVRFFEKNEKILNRYDPFKNGDARLFCSMNIRQLYNSLDEANEQRRFIKNGDVFALMEAIYKVRNNFFHGNKRLGDPTDKKFVTASAAIVRGYLVALDVQPTPWRS